MTTNQNRFIFKIALFCSLFKNELTYITVAEYAAKNWKFFSIGQKNLNFLMFFRYIKAFATFQKLGRMILPEKLSDEELRFVTGLERDDFYDFR